MIARRLVFAVAALSAMAMPVAAAQDDSHRQMDRTIAVVGTASVSVPPDLAVVRAGVVTQAKTAQEAVQGNSKAMAKVLSALKSIPVPQADVQTAQFSVSPVRDDRASGSHVIGFRAFNQVTVKVRALGELGTVLDRLTGAGANDISGIAFTVSHPSKLLDKARVDAFADARRKAELLATVAGARLGPALTISERSEAGSPITPLRMTAAAAAVPIAAGEETVRVSIDVTFALQP